MIDDWSSKSRPDLLHFVPYTWKVNVILKEFELLVPANEHNWIDCSSQNPENGENTFFLENNNSIKRTASLAGKYSQFI